MKLWFEAVLVGGPPGGEGFLSSALATPEIQAIEQEYAPKLAAHNDTILLDSRLYERIRAVHDDTAGMEALGPESRHLVERYLTEFTVAGAGLDDSAKERLRELNAALATITTRYPGAAPDRVFARGDGWGPVPAKDVPPAPAHDQLNRRVVIDLRCP